MLVKNVWVCIEGSSVALGAETVFNKAGHFYFSRHVVDHVEELIFSAMNKYLRNISLNIINKHFSENV